MSLIPFILEQAASNNDRAERCIDKLKELLEAEDGLKDIKTETASRFRETILLAKEPVVVKIVDPVYDSKGKIKENGTILIQFFGGKMPYPDTQEELARRFGPLVAPYEKPKWSRVIKSRLFTEIAEAFTTRAKFPNTTAGNGEQEVEYTMGRKNAISNEKWDELKKSVTNVVTELGYSIKQ